MYTLYAFAVQGIFFLIPHIARAHEVYVLEGDTIAKDMAEPPLQVFSIIFSNEKQFFFWFFFALLAVSFVAIVSMSKRLEKFCDPFLLKIRRYAPAIGRITLGLSTIASAYFGALFGPELPMSLFIPAHFIMPFQILLAGVGICLVLGLFTRVSALFMMVLYGGMITHFSYYMLTYLNYFGEMVIAFTAGSKVFAIDAYFTERVPRMFQPLVDFIVDKGFLILRIAFGISLLFSAIYAKLLHAQLAIDTVVQYHLTDYFHFTPPFIVLGALAVEVLLGLLFIIGFEIRFAAIFLSIFLTLSLFYFGESVWPHIILMGGALTIFASGYGKYTIERNYLIRHHRDQEEPVL